MQFVRARSSRRQGKHLARPSLRRRVLITVVVVVAASVSIIGIGQTRGPGRERRAAQQVCSTPDDLRTRHGITLAGHAMQAFDRAETTAGSRIDVGESYRSCREQALACERICGSRNGCLGTCAPPGLSWHQRGQAVDITQSMLDTAGIVEALEDAGWCQSVPDDDPGHFSFGGCH